MKVSVPGWRPAGAGAGRRSAAIGAAATSQRAGQATEATGSFPARTWLVCAGFVVVVWVLRLAAARYGHGSLGSYNSDEVGGQNLVSDWTQGFVHLSLIGSDTYFLKYPLYLLVNNLPLSPLDQLFMESVLLLAATSGLVLYSLERCFIGKGKRSRLDRRTRLGMYAASAALASIPTNVLILLSFGDSRNLEIGIGMYLVSQVYLYTSGGAVMVSWVSKALHVGLAGCLFADDPLFTFAVGVPAAGVVLLGVMLRSANGHGLRVARHWGVVASVPVAALLAHGIVRGLELALSVKLVNLPVATVASSEVVANWGTLWHSGIEIFGLGRKQLASGATGAGLGLLYAVLDVLGMFGLVKAWWRSPRCLLYPLLLSIVLTSVALYLLTQVESPGSERYMVLCPIVLALGAGVYVQSLSVSGPKWRIAAGVPVGAGFLACILTLGSATAGVATQVHQPNEPQLAVVSILRHLDLHKGYSEYWSTGIERFLAGGSIDMINISCADGTVGYYNWWQDSSLTGTRAQRTFYVVSDTDTSPGVCAPAQLDRFFGKPARIVAVQPRSYGEEVYVYNYDIGTHIPL